MADHEQPIETGQADIPKDHVAEAHNIFLVSDLTEQTVPTPGEAEPGQGDPGDVVISAEKIEEIMAQKRAAAREVIEKEASTTPEERPASTTPGEQAKSDNREPWEKTSDELADEQKKSRRGRPPKADKAEPDEGKAAKPRKSRPARADKAALGDAQPQVRDKVELLTKWGKATVKTVELHYICIGGFHNETTPRLYHRRMVWR